LYCLLSHLQFPPLHFEEKPVHDLCWTENEVWREMGDK